MPTVNAEMPEFTSGTGVRNFTVRTTGADAVREHRSANAPFVDGCCPDIPSHDIGRRLAAAPLDALSVASASVLGCGSRCALLFAAAAGGSQGAEAMAWNAVASLLPVHRERLLDTLNHALAASGRAPV